MYLVHFLPFSMIAKVGNAVGTVMFWLIPERRRVTRINLEKCFPQMPAPEREKLARAHFRAFCRGMVERSVLWWSKPERIRRFVVLEGLEHLEQAPRPAIVFAPHFAGLDAAITRLSMDQKMALMYARQKDKQFDRLLYHGRARFGAHVFPRQAGNREGLRAMAEGSIYFYLPDLDHGRRHAVFVPFFGVPAATITGLSYIARSAGASVVPCVVRMLRGGGYAARLYPAWRDFPSADDAAGAAADARRMLAFVEERVLEMPEQYHWLHKRFKTRPSGERSFY